MHGFDFVVKADADDFESERMQFVVHFFSSAEIHLIRVCAGSLLCLLCSVAADEFPWSRPVVLFYRLKSEIYDMRFGCFADHKACLKKGGADVAKTRKYTVILRNGKGLRLTQELSVDDKTRMAWVIRFEKQEFFEFAGVRDCWVVGFDPNSRRIELESPLFDTEDFRRLETIGWQQVV